MEHSLKKAAEEFYLNTGKFTASPPGLQPRGWCTVLEYSL
jgi:hypothetical protein